MQFTIEIPDQVIKEDPYMMKYMEALKLMANRMVFSHFKYGNMDNKYPHSARAIDSANKRRAMYMATGNTENCIDDANFAVIEHVLPSHPKAFFKPQSSEQSPGIIYKED